jgi:hypothetical protein
MVEKMKLLISFLSVGLVAACSQQDVETMQIPDYCQAWARRVEAMTPEEEKRMAAAWSPAVRRTGFLGADMSQGWCMDCKTGHKYECLALPKGE